MDDHFIDFSDFSPTTDFSVSDTKKVEELRKPPEFNEVHAKFTFTDEQVADKTFS